MLRSDPVICLVLRGMAAPEAAEFLKTRGQLRGTLRSPVKVVDDRHLLLALVSFALAEMRVRRRREWYS
jgi:hypothetical protein